MMVLVLTASPAGLRGDLTKWLLEISPGVYVGNVNARIREKLWERVTKMVRDGRALLVYSANNEQRLEFRVHEHEWEPVDLEGATVLRRPAKSSAPGRRPGWSAASGQRRSRRPAWKQRFQVPQAPEQSAPESPGP